MPSNQTLEQILISIHNWFLRDVTAGEWEIKEGNVDLPNLQEGQYFRIIGSVFNDGLHQYPANDLQDETFTGQVWGLAIPKAMLELADEIEDWIKKYGESVSSPFNSESFENYSYSKASGTMGNGNADPATGWQREFMARLTPFRKLA